MNSSRFNFGEQKKISEAYHKMCEDFDLNSMVSADKDALYGKAPKGNPNRRGMDQMAFQQTRMLVPTEHLTADAYHSSTNSPSVQLNTDQAIRGGYYGADDYIGQQQSEVYKNLQDFAKKRGFKLRTPEEARQYLRDSGRAKREIDSAAKNYGAVIGRNVDDKYLSNNEIQQSNQRLGKYITDRPNGYIDNYLSKEGEDVKSASYLKRVGKQAVSDVYAASKGAVTGNGLKLSDIGRLKRIHNRISSSTVNNESVDGIFLKGLVLSENFIRASECMQKVVEDIDEFDSPAAPLVPASEVPASKEPTTEVPAPKETAPKEPATEVPAPKETAPKEPASEVPASKEPTTEVPAEDEKRKQEIDDYKKKLGFEPTDEKSVAQAYANPEKRKLMAENANTHDGYTAYVNAAFADKNTNYDELKEVVLKNPNMKQYMSDEQSRRLGAGLMSRKIGIDTSQFTEADWYELKKNNPEKYKLAVAYGNEMRKVGLEVFRDEPNVKKIQAWVEENKNKPNSAGKDGERGQIISKIVESGVIDKDGNFSFGGLMKFLWSNPMILFSLIGIIGLPGFVLGKLF